MKIIKCDIQAFGGLTNKKIEFREGLNKILGENGSGKSTLAAFIKAMLFGLSDTRRASLSENERKRYFPWNGSGFGGSMTFSSDTKTYRVERRFGQKPSEDFFALYDTATGKPSADFSENLGEELFGIDADGFEETVFFSEKDLTPRGDNKSVAAKLGGVSDCEGDMGALDEAFKRLDDERRRYSKRGRGQINEIGERIGDKEKELLHLKEKASCLPEEKKKLSQAQKRIDGYRTKIKELTESKDGILLGEITPSGFKKEMGEQKPVEKRRNTGVIFLCLFLLILGLPLGFLISPYLYSVSVAGVLLLVGLLLFGKGKRGKENRTETVKSDIERADLLRKEIERINAEIGECEAELPLIQREIAFFERSIEELEKAEEKICELTEDIKDLRSMLSENEKELEIINLTKKFLLEAKDIMDSKHLGRTRESFRKYCSLISEEPDKERQIDTSLSVSCAEKGISHPREAYSRGTRGLYNLAARLAVTDSLYGEALMPIILDDPFISFDDEKTEKALALLSGIAKSRQVIYLTCSRSRLGDKASSV